MTTAAAPITRSDVYDPARLAARLRELDLPGKRSKTAITKLRRERSRRQVTVSTPDLRARVQRRIVERYTAEIERRGGETEIVGSYGTETLSIADRRDGLTLLHAAGWRHYSSRVPARWAELSYLCGTDDNGLFAVRVPGTVTTVQEALYRLTPAAVRDARAKGRRVLRQGDIYAVETTARYDTPTGLVADSHYWDASTRTLTHQPEDGRAHADLSVPFPAKFIPQTAYQMGRGAGRGRGD